MGDLVPRPRRAKVTFREYEVGDVTEVGIETLWPSVEFTLPRGKLWTVLVDGKPVGFFGCIPHSGYTNVWYEGQPWVQHEIGYLRKCRDVMRDLHAQYGPLYNFVHQPDPKLIKWLRWMGCAVREEGDGTYLFVFDPEQ